MNILIVGSGGREHALAWKISQSPLCKRLFIAPGNAGTIQHGENIEIDVNDFTSLKNLCVREDISLVVVGPEDPLVNGIYDFFKNNVELKDIVVIGPSAAGAQLEGSKSFSKHFMQKQNIPTAAYAEFDVSNYEEGKAYLSQYDLPIVLKADGLAAGKGVIICSTHEEALNAFEEMIINKQFGDASAKVVVEEFLQGIEVSVFVLTDGVDYKIIGHAKDYKRIGEDDSGLNTGGMGCVTPVPFVDDVFMAKVEERIIKPTIQGLHTEQLEYKGFVFIGLMNVDGEPYVIEYNCRLGDPETEVVLPRLKNDLVELLMALAKGQLDTIKIEYDERVVCTVMAVSGGYPGEYSKNKLITLQADKLVDSTTIVFHAGTKQQDNNIVTNGGRVLAVTSFGSNITEAVDESIASLQHISFDGMYYRKDIGFEFSKLTSDKQQFMMKGILIAILLLDFLQGTSQKKDISGTYIRNVVNDIGHYGCCSIHEILNFRNDNTFSFYSEDDQGDYHTEGCSKGKYKLVGDTVFLLSAADDSAKNVKALPLCDSISPGIIRLTFKDYNYGVDMFFHNKYYDVDDSLNIAELKVLKIIPERKTIGDTINKEFILDYEKYHNLKQIEVYLEKPKRNVLFVENKSLSGFSLTIPKEIFQSNDLLVDLRKNGYPYLFDYSGFRMKFLNGSNNLYGVTPALDVSGQPMNFVYQKVNFKNFDSLKVSMSSGGDSNMNYETIDIYKTRLVKYAFNFYNFYTKENSKGDRVFRLTEQVFSDFILALSKSSFFEPPEVSHPPILHKPIFIIGLYFKGLFFTTAGELLSKNIHEYLLGLSKYKSNIQEQPHH